MSEEFLANVIDQFKSAPEFRLTPDEYYLLNIPPVDIQAALRNKNRSPYYGKILSDLQGNILKDHGRNHAVHVFLRFSGDARSARNAIKEFAINITTAADHHKIALAYKHAQREYRLTKNDENRKKFEKARKTHFVGFYLSRKGYNALGFQDKNIPGDPSFRAAMKSRQTRDALFDSYNDWESKYDQVHAMVLIANSDPSLLMPAHIEQLLSNLTKYHVFTEKGDVITERAYVDGLKAQGLSTDGRKKSDEPVEHFGYRDGVSQPLFYAADVQAALKDDLHKKGFRYFDPTAPLALALARDPNGLVRDPKGSNLSYGSYLVFRKYRQDVDAFHEVVDELAQRLTRTMNKESRTNLAKAFIVGRFPDGTPVILKGTQGRTCKRPNDFLLDFDGSRCPLRAHILRTDLRGGDNKVGPFDFAQDHTHRIIRRGITYQDGKEKGLLFMCFQRSLSQQFEFIQGDCWANWKFNPDRLIGGVKAIQDGVWPRKWGDPNYNAGFPQTGIPIHKNLKPLINLKGGEYFFAPSKSFLQNINNSA